MKIEKQVLLEMEGVYAVGCIRRGGQKKLLVSTEMQGCCYELDFRTHEKVCVWNGPGGVMGFADVDAEDGGFCAIQNFFPVFDSRHAVVVRARWDEAFGWCVRNVVNLPYVHRIDAIRTDLGKYFIGATLCSSKRSADDWSDPGKVYVGRYDESGCELQDCHPLLEGLIKNHGYFRDRVNDAHHAYIGAENGVFRIGVPTQASPEWTCEKLCDEATGDVALGDVDGDGTAEMLAVQPFHGEKVCIKKLVGGAYTTVWRYGGQSKLGHVAWAGTLLGKPAFLFGFREGRGELVAVVWENGAYKATEIDAGISVANVCVVHEGEKEHIVLSNYNQGQALLYTLTH